jgi:hypothetical protein
MNRQPFLCAALLIGSVFLAPAALAVSQTVDLGGTVTSGTLASGNFTIGRLHFVITAAGGFTVTQTGGRLYVSENVAEGDFRMVVTADTGGEFGMKSIYLDQVSTGGPAGWGPYLSASFGGTGTSIPLSSLTGSATVSFTAFGYRTGQQLIVEDIENLAGIYGAMQTKFYLDDMDVDLAAVAPTCLDLVRSNPATSVTNADSLTWRFVFSETVSGVDASDFVIGGTTATVTSVTGSGATYNVTVSGGNLANLEGSVWIGFSGAHSIVNGSGLNLTNLNPTRTNEYTYTVSNLHPPTLTATGNNPTFTEDGSAVDLYKSVTAAVGDSGQTFSSLQIKVTGWGVDDSLQFGSTTIPLVDGTGVSLTGIAGYASVDVVSGTATISITGLNQADAPMAALLDGMTFRNTGNNPGSTARVVTVTGVTDSGGYFNSTTLNLVSTVTVIPVNDAPVLVPAAPTLGGISEDAIANAGQTVASFVGSSITDPDGGAVQGIAISATVPGSGTWQYSLNNGGTWNAMGAVSASSALLLRATDKVRFVPDSIHAGSANFTYRAWDQTGATAGQQGTKASVTSSGGSNPFSSAVDTATIAIASAAPTTYADWAADVFTAAELADTAISGVNADPDGAGVTNLMRYALDLPARGPVSVVTSVALGADDTSLMLNFPVRAVADGLSYDVQSSQDLVTWTTEATYTANGTKQQISHPVAVPTGAKRFFLRLQVR